MTQYNPGLQGDVSTDRREDPGEPSMFRVLLHNDDYTTMEFVIDILMNVFHKTHEEAVGIMLKVHQEGVGICGIYPYDIAQTKVNAVLRLATEHEYPLKSTLEQV